MIKRVIDTSCEHFYNDPSAENFEIIKILLSDADRFSNYVPQISAAIEEAINKVHNKKNEPVLVLRIFYRLFHVHQL